jgi:hypothetical protein
MNVHKNARLTPRGRERIALQVASGQTPKAFNAARRSSLASASRSNAMTAPLPFEPGADQLS